MEQEIMFGLMEVPIENVFQIGLVVGAAMQMLFVIIGNIIFKS